MAHGMRLTAAGRISPMKSCRVFSTDHAAAARLRVLVEIREMQDEYTAALLVQKPEHVAAEWWLCSAPPDAHARAFVQVMGTP